MKILAERSTRQIRPSVTDHDDQTLTGIKANTVRIARLRLLMISAKVVTAPNRDNVRYSVRDSRMSGLFAFLKYLDLKRGQPKLWAT